MAGCDNVEEVKESMLSTAHREQCKGQMSLSRACHVGVSEYIVSVDSLRLMFLLVSYLTQSDWAPPQGLCDRLGLVPAFGYAYWRYLDNNIITTFQLRLQIERYCYCLFNVPRKLFDRLLRRMYVPSNQTRSDVTAVAVFQCACGF